MAKRTKKKGPKQVETLTHDAARRKNIPSAEHASIAERFEEIHPFEPVTYARANPLAQGETRDRDADLDPQLVWKGTELRLTAAQIEALKAGEKVELGEAQLVWRGKDTQDWSDLVVQAPPIYVQEKIHPKHIIEDLKKQTQKRRDAETDAPMFNLFGDFNGLDPEARTEFYQHDQHWQNRMILGNSLQVMASLAERENLRGKVQCIYFDPPYGIKFNSNWQVSTRSRDVKDGKLDQITREPEQVRAFRDTWKDGIHSYLTYLRDRLTAMRDLLTESGSIFVQIGDENVHRVRALMDEVFGEENFISEIVFKKTGGHSAAAIANVNDLILWYGRSLSNLKVRSLFIDKKPGEEGATNYTWIEQEDGSRRALTSKEKQNMKMLPDGARVMQPYPMFSDGPSERDEPLIWQEKTYSPSSNSHWKTHSEGIQRLLKADRLVAQGKTLRFVNFLSDYAVTPVINLWTDTQTSGFGADRRYIVETNPLVVQRCILMATDPGDLVLDPTCGSGTTATVAEQWGRRWITIDTSRVALALARTRLMSARYPFYLLADSLEGRKKEEQLTGQRQPDIKPTGDIRQGFVYERAPHITLKSIANNAEIDVIWEKWQQILEPLRLELNAALGRGNPPQPSLIREGANEKSPPDKGDLGGSGKPTHIPYAPHLTDRARDLRNNPTPAEKKLWREVLSSNRLEGLKFLRQKPLGDYIVDFYCAEMMLAIELDGETHADQAAYDAKRTRALAKFGIQIARYTNAEVINNLDAVYEDLQRHVLALRNPPQPSLIREGADGENPPDKGGGLKPWQEWEIPRDPEAGWSGDAREIHAKWWEARIKRQQEIDASIAQKADVEYLYDRPYADPSRVRVAGPFTVESLSPHRVIPADESELIDELDALEGNRPRPQAPAQDFATMVLENLKSAGIHQSDKQDRIAFTAIEGWPGDYIAATGTYERDGILRKAAIFIGPEFGSITRSDLMAAAREANEARFDVLIACGFNFDAHSSEVNKLGPLPILKAKMNPDLHMADDLKNTGAGNLFVVFGEPDIAWNFDKDGKIIVEVLGIDVFDPKTGDVRASGKDDIAAWFIDTDYDEESFFVRHAYFLGANDPYKSLKSALKAEIDPEVWASLYRDVSQPFERPSTGRFAVKVINHFGDEVMKVFGVS